MEVGGENISVTLECKGLGKAEPLDLGRELSLTFSRAGGGCSVVGEALPVRYGGGMGFKGQLQCGEMNGE